MCGFEPSTLMPRCTGAVTSLLQNNYQEYWMRKLVSKTKQEIEAETNAETHAEM